MKNKLFIIILLCILLCCAGCSADHLGGDVSDLHVDPVMNVDRASTSGSQTDGSPPEPPEMLLFDSFEQIAELYSIAAQDEETVTAYLDQKGFSMNSLSTKSDVVELFERIGDLNMLHLDSSSGYELKSILYYVTYGYIMSTYTCGDDMVRFRCYIGAGDEPASSDIDNIESNFEGTLTIGTTSVGLRSVAETSTPYAFIGIFKTTNSRITILLSENDGVKVDSIGTNIVLSKLMDLITD